MASKVTPSLSSNFVSLIIFLGQNSSNIILYYITLYYTNPINIVANMELSTSSGILLTDQAKELIDELTQLDNNKENIFERLYVLWTSDGVGQITVLKNRFESNRNFISESIVRSFNEKVQRAMKMILMRNSR